MRKGLAGPFLIKLSSQPQITAAYLSSAPVRSQGMVEEASALLQSVQVGALTLLCPHTEPISPLLKAVSHAFGLLLLPGSAFVAAQSESRDYFARHKHLAIDSGQSHCHR